MRIYTSMHSGGLELTKLTYSRHEDNLLRHRGDRLTLGPENNGLLSALREKDFLGKKQISCHSIPTAPHAPHHSWAPSARSVVDGMA